jgi:UDP-N-acetylglucosamine acyltransferase
MSIHSTAVIDAAATIGKGNTIGPHVVIQGPVIIGNDNRIGPGAIITGNTEIGDGNEISGHAYIGNDPQDVSFGGGDTYVKIGNNNIIREFANIHRGTKPGTCTVIGDNNFLMVGVHVAHNCLVGNNVIMVNGAAIGGYCEVHDHAFLSAFVIVHQFTRIGSYTICGILAKITKDVPPFMMVAGNPSTVRGLNLVGLRRKGFDQGRRQTLRAAYKIIYRKGYSLSHALSELRLMTDSEDVQQLIRFIESSKRGILLKSPDSPVSDMEE